MGFPADYAKQMKGKFGMQVMWPPNLSVDVGDFGTLKGKNDGATFERLGNISTSLGIPFKTRDGAAANQTLISEDVSIVNLGVQGEGPGKAAGLDITFSKSNQMIFEAVDVLPRAIEDLYEVGMAIKAKLANKEWKSNYVLVTAAHATPRTVIYLASKSNTSVTVSGSKDLNSENMASASADLSVERISQGIVDYSCFAPSTPLLTCHKVNKKGDIDMALPGDQFVETLPEDALALGDGVTFSKVAFKYCG